VPHHDFAGLSTLGVFALLGLACGVFALVLTKGLFLVEEGYRRLPIPQFWTRSSARSGSPPSGLPSHAHSVSGTTRSTTCWQQSSP
jgi:hypothetical protein